MEYSITRKLQEQSGSYQIVLPKVWVEARGLKESDPLILTFNDDVHIKPVPKPSGRGATK
jgi:AbrB family looped-hinge helix DNA binding protein